ncbi:hypothetical protein LMG3410_01499 [Achromobacter aegrifaciens]|uniref:Uncharacterized protein n=1 Tax=Achromobacter mucicolens TaxID=1389922 RepID=A0ABM8LKB6_9BURK|nr:hypothetical protein LMG3410_01499 [Achromobacter aegrifaciens]CAB3914386.1 hypothetical protein LMG3415_05150 [Achromobacter mucicolens]
MLTREANLLDVICQKPDLSDEIRGHAAIVLPVRGNGVVNADGQLELLHGVSPLVVPHHAMPGAPRSKILKRKAMLGSECGWMCPKGAHTSRVPQAFDGLASVLKSPGQNASVYRRLRRPLCRARLVRTERGAADCADSVDVDGVEPSAGKSREVGRRGRPLKLDDRVKARVAGKQPPAPIDETGQQLVWNLRPQRSRATGVDFIHCVSDGHPLRRQSFKQRHHPHGVCSIQRGDVADHFRIVSADGRTGGACDIQLRCIHAFALF